jgi:hypothetical protein
MHSSKVFFLVSFISILGIGSSYAQKVRPINQPAYDRGAIHFGFSLGISTYSFNVEPYAGLAQTDSIYTIESKPTKGYTIGIVSDLKLTKRLNLRFIPTLSYTQRNLDYTIHFPTSGKRELVSRTVESTFVDFPFNLKYKSDRLVNGRAYVLGGVKFSIDMASQQKVDDASIFKLKSADFYWELGVGTDFYFEFFKLSPEIKFSMGNRNMLVDDDSIYTSGIKKLRSRCLVFSLNFE